MAGTFKGVVHLNTEHETFSIFMKNAAHRELSRGNWVSFDHHVMVWLQWPFDSH